MNDQELAVLKLMKEQSAEKRLADEYERDCKRVFGGFLSALDVCRLFGEHRSGSTEAPGAEARRLISEQGLPLLEIGPGRFVVGHVFMIPEEAS